jgi:hypothetical protein
MIAPENRQRAEISMSGGQSSIATLEIAKAELQIRQNAATMTGSGTARGGGTVTGTGRAARIGVSLLDPM